MRQSPLFARIAPVAAGVVVAVGLGAGPGKAWQAPGRGTADRAALMDAVRPLAEWNLDAPVEFVVDELRVSGDAALVRVSPQRPGGGGIDPYDTPMVTRDGADPEYMDGLHMEALLVRDGRNWEVVHWAIGSTDVWYAGGDYCESWADVLPEFCY